MERRGRTTLHTPRRKFLAMSLVVVVCYTAACLLGSLTNGKATPGCVTTCPQGCTSIFGVNVTTSLMIAIKYTLK